MPATQTQEELEFSTIDIASFILVLVHKPKHEVWHSFSRGRTDESRLQIRIHTGNNALTLTIVFVQKSLEYSSSIESRFHRYLMIQKGSIISLQNISRHNLTIPKKQLLFSVSDPKKIIIEVWIVGSRSHEREFLQVSFFLMIYKLFD